MATRSDIFSFFYSPQSAIPFLLIAAGFIYTSAIYNWGPGITDDSVNYLYASTTFPNSLNKVDHTPFVEWPPLFPVILSAHQIFGISVITFAAILHGLAYAANVVLSWIMLRKLINSGIIFFLATLTILFSTPLLLVHIFVWSEAIFIFFLLVSLLVLTRYLNRSRDIYILILLIIISWLMGLQRKSAIVLFLSNFSIILFYGKSSPLLKKFIHATAYIVLSSLPLFFYGLRKYKIKNEIFTQAGYDPVRIAENFIDIAEVFTSWFFPDELSLQLRVLLFAGTAGLILLIIRLSSRIKRPKFQCLEVILFTTSVLYFLILSFSLAYVYVEEGIDERILSPVYIPVIICSFVLADITYRKVSLLPFSGDFIYRRIFILLLLTWVLYPVIRSTYHIRQWNKYGTGGYNTVYWKENHLPDIIAAINPNVPVYTNNIYASVYLVNLEGQIEVEFRRIEHKKGEDEYFALCFSPGYQHISQESCSLPLLHDKILLKASSYGEIWKVNKRGNGQ